MSKVTVVGAGKYGSTTVQRIAAMDIADEVVMTDIVEGLPQGLALDMNQSRPLERYRTLVTGTNDYADTAGSDVVVITAGLPRKPGMSRMDLLEVNAKIVADVTRNVLQHSADPVIIVVTNPLDHMTTLAAEVSGLPVEKVMGQAGNLDSARFAHFIAEAAGADILDVEALTLGSHGETMVPVPSQCRVAGRPPVPHSSFPSFGPTEMRSGRLPARGMRSAAGGRARRGGAAGGGSGGAGRRGGAGRVSASGRRGPSRRRAARRRRRPGCAAPSRASPAARTRSSSRSSRPGACSRRSGDSSCPRR